MNYLRKRTHTDIHHVLFVRLPLSAAYFIDGAVGLATLGFFMPDLTWRMTVWTLEHTYRNPKMESQTEV